MATAKSVEAERLRDSIEAAEQERKRWARELHDETLQALGGAADAALGRPARRAVPSDLRAALEQGIELIDAEIDNLSALIAELRPPALDEIGLAPALRTLAERKRREGGVDDRRAGPARRAGRPSGCRRRSRAPLYRLVQEALNNVVKHAGAGRAEAVLERVGDARSRSAVSDDGRGFDPDRRAAAASASTGMRERVELAGGELRIEAAAGRGTTVAASIPLAGERGAHSLEQPAVEHVADQLGAGVERRAGAAA